MSVLLITHDLGVVAALADQVVVLYGGQAVEQGSTRQILSEPLHPYTQSLLAARSLSARNSRNARFTSAAPPNGEPGDVMCPFIKHCSIKMERCKSNAPSLLDLGEGRRVRCFAREPSDG